MRQNAATGGSPARYGGKIAALGAVLALCLLFKWSMADADALRLDWILKPTSAIVSLFTGMDFISLDGLGYFNAENAVLIAPACSGINFFVILLATGGCLAVLLIQTTARRLLFMPFIAALAFIFTLAVNTARILIAIELYRHVSGAGLFTPERLHRVEGVVVYYVCLCLFAMLVSRMLRAQTAVHGAHRKQSAGPSLPGHFKVFLPLGCYLLFTLGVPLANGAAVKAPALFAEHSLTVLALSTAISLALYRLWRKKVRIPRSGGGSHDHETPNTHCRR